MPQTTEAPERLLEFNDCRGVALKVDREAGMIRGVKILGAVSRNGRRYSPAAMAGAVGLYEGIGVNVDHIDAKEQRSYHGRMGYLTRPVVRDDGVYGDLRVNPKHGLAEQLFWDAENAPQNVGLSHDATGTTKRRDGETVVESITAVRSVDLVAEPASTRGLFESLDKGDPSMSTDVLSLREAKLAELKAQRPDLVEALKAELSEGDRTKALEAENAALKEKLEEAATKEATAKHRAAVEAELTEAKLDKPGDVFLDVLLAEQDAEKRKALIADRKRLVEAAAKAGKPKSDFAGETSQDDDGAFDFDHFGESIREPAFG